MSNRPTLTWEEYQKLPPEKRQRPLTAAEYKALTRSQLAQAGLEDDEAGAPVDFAGPVFLNPDHIQPQLDTDAPIAPTRLPNGVQFQRGNFNGRMPADTSNPAPAQILPGQMRTIGADTSPAIKLPPGATLEASADDAGEMKLPPGATLEGGEEKKTPSFWEDPKGFLTRRAADLQKEAQHQTDLAMGPESDGQAFHKRLGHRLLSLAPETAAVVDKLVAGGMEWKNAIAIASGLIDPAIPAAYFGGHGAAQLTGVEPGINAGDTSPENVQNALMAASAVAGGAGATKAPNAGRAATTTADILSDRAVRTAPVRAAARAAETAINQKLVPVKKLAKIMTPADSAESLTVKVPGRDYGIAKPKPAAAPPAAAPALPPELTTEARSLPGQISAERISGPRPKPAAPIPTRQGLLLKAAEEEPLEDLEGVTSDQTDAARDLAEEEAPPDTAEPAPSPVSTSPADFEKHLNAALGGKKLVPGVALKNQPAAMGVVKLPEGFTPVDSSALSGFKYSPETREFESITKTGAHYVHGDVSPEQAQAFEAAESKGKAWNELRSKSPLVAKVVNGERVAAKPPTGMRSVEIGPDGTPEFSDVLAQKRKNLQDFIRPDETPAKKTAAPKSKRAIVTDPATGKPEFSDVVDNKKSAPAETAAAPPEEQDLTALLEQSLDQVKAPKGGVMTSAAPADLTRRWGVDRASLANGREQTRGMSPEQTEQEIAKLTEAYKNGQAVEPVMETRDAGNNIVEVDGRMRAIAAQRAGVERIPVMVRRLGVDSAEAAPGATSGEAPKPAPSPRRGPRLQSNLSGPRIKRRSPIAQRHYL
jgi:hypothetical protein